MDPSRTRRKFLVLSTLFIIENLVVSINSTYNSDTFTSRTAQVMSPRHPPSTPSGTCRLTNFKLKSARIDSSRFLSFSMSFSVLAGFGYQRKDGNLGTAE